MSNPVDVIYRYDGSFDGVLCCVFESYEKKEIPIDILSPDSVQSTLLPVKDISTDPQKAGRVLASIPRKLGGAALEFLRQAFLTCFAQKELYILLFLRRGYQCGPSIMRRLTDEAVHPLVKAVRYLERESHLFKGFIRFSCRNQVLVAEIEPKNYVLPLLARHFGDRFPEERFLIYDKTHHMGLVYQPYTFAVMPIEDLLLPEPDEEEEAFRQLWRIFYETIEIKGRHNPKCRMTQMPKRYWKYMTEFASDSMSSNRKFDESKKIAQGPSPLRGTDL